MNRSWMRTHLLFIKAWRIHFFYFLWYWLSSNFDLFTPQPVDEWSKLEKILQFFFPTCSSVSKINNDKWHLSHKRLKYFAYVGNSFGNTSQTFEREIESKVWMHFFQANNGPPYKVYCFRGMRKRMHFCLKSTFAGTL